jgi:hypothetical protein
MRGAGGKLFQVRRGVATELKYLGLIRGFTLIA